VARDAAHAHSTVNGWERRDRRTTEAAEPILYGDRVDVAKMVELSTRWWQEVWRDGDVDVVDEILTDPFVRHSAAGTTTTSRDEYKRMLSDFQRTLHRPETTIEARDIVGDRIWTRATSRGVNLQTGERSVVSWLLLQRIDHDRIAEHWALTLAGVEWTA
jgi:hypothetical protein